MIEISNDVINLVTEKKKNKTTSKSLRFNKRISKFYIYIYIDSC